MGNGFNRLVRDMSREFDDRHRRERQTPRVLYEARHRPQRIGVVHVGVLTIGSDGGLLYANGIPGVRAIADKDLAEIELLEEQMANLEQRRDALLKRIWKRSRELSLDEVAARGAEDCRGRGE